MTPLPYDFETATRALMGPDAYEQLAAALEQEPPVSIRLNPFKGGFSVAAADGPVPWCPGAFYLPSRPAFTFDPLLHAGVYYVQEASSMFLHHVLRQHVAEAVSMLDLCAAPGGKSTVARAALPQGSLLVSNEPVRPRAQVLSENMQKFGHPDVIVTNKRLYARTGIIDIKDQVCDLSNIADVTVDPTLFGRLFDYANVRIQTYAGESDFVLRGIAHAYDMRSAISQGADATRSEGARPRDAYGRDPHRGAR